MLCVNYGQLAYCRLSRVRAGRANIVFLGVELQESS